MTEHGTLITAKSDETASITNGAWFHAPRRTTLVLPACFLAWLILRLAYNACRQLVPDEAYYWVWSRHLAASYFDHPPVVAYAIRLGTALFGDDEFGVRVPAAVMAAGAAALMTGLAWRWTRDRRATAWTAAVLLTSPAVCVLGTIVTPDVPAVFFQAAALGCAATILMPATDVESLGRGRRWLAFGLLAGLSLDSKYTGVLLGVAVLATLVASPRGRKHLAAPWVWLGAAAALACFSPVVYWNARHHWASFAFQLRHGLGQADETAPGPLASFAGYVGGQAVVWTPVLFVYSVAVLGIFWRRLFRGALRDDVARLLLFAATVPLLFFAYSSLKRKVEPNWPVFAYLPATLLLVRYAAERWPAPGGPAAERYKWLRIGVIVAVVGGVVLQVPEAILLPAGRFAGRVGPTKGFGKLDDLFGWKELAGTVAAARGGRPVYANTYQDASELSFYLPGQPTIWSLNAGDARPNAFDFFPGRPDPAAAPEVLLVGKFDRSLVPGDDVARVERFEPKKFGRALRYRNLVFLYRAPASAPAR